MQTITSDSDFNNFIAIYVKVYLVSNSTSAIVIHLKVHIPRRNQLQMIQTSVTSLKNISFYILSHYILKPGVDGT